MVSTRSRFILPALAGLFSLTLTAPALANAPAVPDEAFLEASLPSAEALLPAPEQAAAVALLDPNVPAAAVQPAPVLPAPAAPAAPAAPELRAEDLEAALLARVNVDREALGLAPLAADPELLTIARTRAAAQIGAPTLSHYDASGKIAVQLLLYGGGFRYTLAGENLARLRPENSTAVAQATEEAEVALMNSPLHRKNILEPRFTRLAIGAVRGPDGKLIYAQIFRAA